MEGGTGAVAMAAEAVDTATVIFPTQDMAESPREQDCSTDSWIRSCSGEHHRFGVTAESAASFKRALAAFAAAKRAREERAGVDSDEDLS